MRKHFRKVLPTADTLFSNRFLRRLRPLLGHPRLWHLHRRSVAMGIAIGLVTGLIPLPIQMLMGMIVAVLLRGNVPAAAFATLATNPLTFIPLYLLAYQMGAWITGSTAPVAMPPDMHWDWEGIRNAIPQLYGWIEAAGSTLLVGLGLLAALLALGGYLLVMVSWRITVTLAWRNRRRLRSLRGGN